MWSAIFAPFAVCLELFYCSFFRSLEEEGKARMGVVECTKHNLVEPFNVLYERDGECSA